MDTLTIELKNPNAKKLIEDLADLDLISILKTSSWSDRWQKFSATLPNIPTISENEILDEIRITKNNNLSDKSKQKPIDEITLMAEPSLEEEWNSPEDQRWDNLL